MKYAWIDSERGSYPLERLCEVLDVSASGYADGKAGGQCQNRLSDRALVALIRAIHAETKGAYGAPRACGVSFASEASGLTRSACAN